MTDQDRIALYSTAIVVIVFYFLAGLFFEYYARGQSGMYLGGAMFFFFIATFRLLSHFFSNKQ